LLLWRIPPDTFRWRFVSFSGYPFFSPHSLGPELKSGALLLRDPSEEYPPFFCVIRQICAETENLFFKLVELVDIQLKGQDVDGRQFCEIDGGVAGSACRHCGQFVVHPRDGQN
jgi:hypothetical protein